MTSYPIQRINIPEEWLPFSLWFHQTMHQKIKTQVEEIETEIFAFQFRYQCTVEGAQIIPEAEDDPILPKKSTLHDIFREIARLLHPDRATDAQDAARRTDLLAQANQAVQNGDIEFLQSLINQHTEKKLSDREKVMTLKFQIHTMYGKKYQLLSSSTWELIQLELQWAEQGRDLLSYLAEQMS